MRIIYKNQDNSVSVLTPTQESLSFATIEQIAEKDVPSPCKYAVEWTTYINEDSGEEEIDEITKYEIYHTPYWIVEDSDIPTDRTFRSAWEIDESFGEPNGFGGESNEFDAELLKAYYGELNDTTKDMLLESQRLIDEQKVLNDSIKTTITQIEELVK